jgi:hypothetical protein
VQCLKCPHYSVSQGAKYHTTKVPFPMKTKEVFEQSLRMPIGREYNGEKVFRDMIRPAVSFIFFLFIFLGIRFFLHYCLRS